MTIFKRFPRQFWIANSLELFERFAWYGMFMVLALYLTGSQDTGALGFSQAQKGQMMGIVVGTLYLMPVITGALSDRFGYKLTLILAFAFMGLGYSLMAVVDSYPVFFVVFFITAFGAALFKPVISATIANTTTDKTSSIGFGIFYMMVNMGAFLGPMFAASLRQNGWEHVFYGAALLMGVNMILSLLFFSPDVQEKKKNKSFAKEIRQAVKNIGVALSDTKFVVFLFIVVGFWTMYNQLFYTLPTFIHDWMDTRELFDKVQSFWPWLANKIGTEQGGIQPEIMTNLDALYIILFQLLVSWGVMKWRPVNSMMTGFLVSSIGLGLTFMQHNPVYLFITILIFGLGEMASSPKITEYIGKIAPRDKMALYMGCSFLPMAGGNYLAGWLSGNPYARLSDKAVLLRQDLLSKGIEVPALSDSFTKTDLYQLGENTLQMNHAEMTSYLWENYNPSSFWMIITGIGVGCFAMLFLYDRYMLKSGRKKS
ncbi:MAG: MFS transporter [Bacteroidota bacterium]